LEHRLGTWDRIDQAKGRLASASVPAGRIR
jgi:hypothetical protein